MYRIKGFICIALLCGLTTACSDDDPKTTNPSKDMGKDMTMVDMKTTTDMKDPKDMKTLTDMGKDLGKDFGSDMGKDMPGDMGVDQGPDMMDMLSYPDLMEFPCSFPSTDPNCATGYGPGSYITKLKIVEDNSCCRDFDGDGNNDNFIGASLISTAKLAFQQDVNANIEAAINAGAMVYLIEYRDWSNEAYDPTMTLGLLNGVDTDGSLAENTAGNGEFNVLPDSFDAQGLPKYNFPVGMVHNYKMTANDGRMKIFFPGLIDGVELILVDVQIKATVKPGANLAAEGHAALGNGTISGAMLREPLFTSINAISNRCTCIGKDIFTFDAQTNKYQCTLNEDSCTMDPNSDCRNIGQKQLCSTLSFVSGRADLDVDKDGKTDAYSMGATFEAVPTKLKRF